MKQTIRGEQPFQVLATNFSISPSNEGYTLQISADGTNYSDLFTVGSDTTRMVTGVSNGSYFRLKDNESTVVVNWVTQCSDGGSGGGGTGAQGPAGPQGPQGPAGAGDPSAIAAAIDANNTLIEDGDIIAGMAKQLYSPDGVTSQGTYAYRTTAGDEDVSTGPAELRLIGGSATYGDPCYDDSAVLMREGSEVEGFNADFGWGTSEEWEALPATGSPDSQILTDYQARKFRIDVHSNRQLEAFDYLHFELSNNDSGVPIRFYPDGSSMVWDGNTTQVDSNHYIWSHNGVSVAIEVDTNWATATITDDGIYVKRFWSYDSNLERDVYVEESIPNDVPVGESTYTYDGSDWSPSLPQAVTAMTLNGETYVPQNGDEITITSVLYSKDSAVYPQPVNFVALGLNSFTKDGSPINTSESDCKIYYDAGDEYGHWGGGKNNTGFTTYFIKAITGLENGYVLHSESGKLSLGAGVSVADNYEDATDQNVDFEYGNTEVIEANKTLVVYPTTAMPYIIFSVADGDESDICVHPRWSGYRDEDYEDYAESMIDLSAFAEYPLVSVGDVKNYWDVKNGKAIINIGTMPFTEEDLQGLIDGGKVLGTDFEIDDTYIYYVLDETEEYDVTSSYNYDANDFSVEYFTEGVEEETILSIPVYAETWYMSNLVDKLRRMEGLIHIDNLNGTGNENAIYECDGELWYWSSESGTVAEWTNKPDESGFGSYRGYALKFSHIPDGQVLFEAKYTYDGDSEYKAFKMSGDTLVMTNTGGTVLSACTLGNSAQMQVRTNNNSYVVRIMYNKHIIGFDMTGALSFRNVWDGNVSGGHFCITDHYKYPYLYGVTTDIGIPRWNNKGQIVGKEVGYNTKGVYFNTTGSSSSYRLTVLTTGSNGGPDRMFVPSQSGTQGQILQSNGNAEPSWINWIKAVKVTSDEYDALVQAGTTDPSTLYLLVD